MKYKVSILALMAGLMVPGAAFAFDNGGTYTGDPTATGSTAFEVPTVSGFTPDGASQYVLVNSTSPTTPVSASTVGVFQADGTLSAGYSWVTVDSLKKTWANEDTGSGTAAAFKTGTNSGAVGDYLVWGAGTPKAGTLVTKNDAAALGFPSGSNPTAGQIAAAGLSMVVPTGYDPKTIPVLSGDYTYNKVSSGSVSSDKSTITIDGTNGSKLTVDSKGKYTLSGADGVTTTGSVKSGSLTTTGDATIGGKLTVGGVDVGQALATGTTNSAGIAALTTTVDGHTQQIGTIKGDIVTLQTDAGVLTGKVNAQGVIIDDHGTRIGSLEGWQGGLNGSTTGGSIVTKSTTGATTTVNGDGFTYSDGKGGKVEIGGDPTITVTNGTSTTKIVNGSITNNGGTNTTGGTTTDTLHVTGASVFDNAVTINTGGGHTTTVNGSGATFANATGSTKVDGGNVTSTGTTKTGSLDVQHDANVGGSMNVAGYVASSTAYVGTFSGNAMTGGSSEIGNALTSYGAALADHNDRIGSLEGWQGVAKGQIANLQDQNKKALAGVAVALAAPNVTLSNNEQWGVGANYGTFGGHNALGAGFAIGFGGGWQGNARVATDLEQGQFGASVGVLWKH